ncbi:cysteine desulfurase family protein [Cellulomonas sp. HZM]|uniref:cysteine desulfurase family protein n=1 Tax=Cellulomonas sp. HZM TaxID=1454010 RepID=UPI0004931E37|nr:cysteine desulfurase family protein [Cellulomonas sp. HZM]
MTAYLDHAATTPMLPVAARVLAEQAVRTGNPSSLHGSGRAARRVVEESRERLAAALGARPSEVVWTSGGTEADNLAVKGLFWARRTQDPGRRRLLVSAVEHHAVLDPAFWMAEHAGAELVLLPVDADGVLDVEALRDELERNGDQAALISVMWANNEVGALQPLDDVVALARRHGVPVHADAVQAVGQVPVDFAASGLDALTVSGHKAGGPGGTGALLARRGLELTPVLHGGGQERGVRSGTLDFALLASFAAAVDAAVAARPSSAPRLAALRDELVAGVLGTVPGAVLRGPADAARRLPANAHLTFAGCEGDSLLYLLDSAGVEASTGSACQAGVPRPSHVLLAMGVSETDARGALRFTLGHTSTSDDVAAVLDVLPGVVERARAAGLAGVA